MNCEIKDIKHKLTLLGRCFFECNIFNKMGEDNRNKNSVELINNA